MAVYTDVSDTDLDRFLADYDVGAVHSCKGIAEGVENTNYLLHTDAGAFILTLYEKRVDPADLPFFLGLMAHLAGKGVNCPLPVARRDGALTGMLAGRNAALITFLEGVWVRRPGVLHCHEVGRTLAELHLAGADFALTRRNALSLQDWRPLWSRCDNPDAIEPGLSAEIEGDLALLEAHWPADLPRGVIHADMFPNNVFFLGGKLSGVIDFYFACTDLLAYDIAVCLNAWCFERDGSFNLTKGRAMLEGYGAVRPLNTAEADALPLMARGAALRFMLT
ncbi:MAG TPA: homoserine kinase, partial [Rhizobiaceae bacterium]|nr:homoserine kinase [Rhizobiaceae bacterium]